MQLRKESLHQQNAQIHKQLYISHVVTKPL